jgi:hypothetical protein
LQVGHALSYRLDHAGSFHAQLQWHLHGIQAAALIDVNEIQPHGLVADADFTRTRVTHQDLDKLKFFGAAVFGDVDGSGAVLRHGLLESIMGRTGVKRTTQWCHETATRVAHCPLARTLTGPSEGRPSSVTCEPVSPQYKKRFSMGAKCQFCRGEA